MDGDRGGIGMLDSISNLLMNIGKQIRLCVNSQGSSNGFIVLPFEVGASTELRPQPPFYEEDAHLQSTKDSKSHLPNISQTLIQRITIADASYIS